MATYIQGIPQYIPQFQPYQPDYNFLGNILQTKQSQYDQSYKQLSKTYGTLLSSPMLREDNIMKRNEFFKMIDNDIKRISGLDLSLQQNVDSANKVFDSFFQNKDLVHDMTYTKEYQKQLQLADNYKNCTDKTCDGKYWDVGVNALHYKADEYKKADKNSAMSMSPGKYVPQINVQEKAVDYLKDLLGKGGNGGFGVENVTWSKDGRYMITTKNGANLSIPFQQIMQAVYGKDQKVIDMYNTQSYVNRKGFVQQNAEKFGSEDAAEDEYFRQLDSQFQQAQMQHDEAQAQQNMIRNRKNVLEENIKKYGSTGNDSLSKSYYAASVDDALSKDVVNHTAQTLDVAKSVFDAGEDRATRRQRADQLFARSLMNKEISESAVRAVAMTGSAEVKEDPYAMKHYDFSLDMAKLQKQYDLMDRNEQRKAVYDLNKEKALSEYKKRGSAVGPENKPIYLDRYKGTTDPTAVSEAGEIQSQYESEKATLEGSAYAYSNGYANTLQGLATDPSISKAEREYAKDTLESMFNAAKKDANGKYISAGYDKTTGKFIDPYGNEHDTPSGISSFYNAQKLYDVTKTITNINKGIKSHAMFIDGEGKTYENSYLTNQRTLSATTAAWKSNNKNIKSYGTIKLDSKELGDWNALFTSDNRLKSADDYKKEYMATHPGADQEDAMDVYNDMNEKYNKFYNQGNTTGKDVDGNPVPLVVATHGSSSFNMLGGGRSAGGATMYEFNSENVASLGNRGLSSIYYDALKPGGMITIGNAENKAEAEGQLETDKTTAKTALTQLIMDLKSGKLTKGEADFVKGQIAYMDLALSDRNTVGAHIIPPASWLKTYKGTKDNPSWADDERLLSEGIGVYADRRTAENDFTQAYKMKPYDYILNHMDVPLSDPNGGNFVIHKRDANGNITVTGDFYAYDKNGVLQPIPNSKTYSANVGGQNLYNGIMVGINEMAQANQIYTQSKGKIIKDPAKLPEIQETLRVASGGEEAPMDPNEIFTRGIQQALYGQK